MKFTIFSFFHNIIYKRIRIICFFLGCIQCISLICGTWKIVDKAYFPPLFEQDALPTFPDAEAFACIERELGLPLESIYSAISPSPIAAASLGQVYKARLKYSGQVVAVKVQRPGIEEVIGVDFYLIRGLGSLINKYVDFISSDVVALIDEFARRVYQELNYVQVRRVPNLLTVIFLNSYFLM